jgi:hypothetical protein
VQQTILPSSLTSPHSLPPSSTASWLRNSIHSFFHHLTYLKVQPKIQPTFTPPKLYSPSRPGTTRSTFLLSLDPDSEPDFPQIRALGTSPCASGENAMCNKSVKTFHLSSPRCLDLMIHMGEKWREGGEVEMRCATKLLSLRAAFLLSGIE